MIKKPLDVLHHFEVRKSKKQKIAFRDAAEAYFEKLGYETKTENGSFGAKNLIAGDPAKAKFLVTAHYDTCASMPFPNFITPCNLWIYLGYQLLLVLGFFVCAALIGFVSALLIPDTLLAQNMAFAVYWVLLLLLMFGPANLHTANDNTSGVVTVLDMAQKLPKELRQQVCFVLFDLEEAGLFGSAGYQSKHKKETRQQLVLNLDCVGDGDEILFFPSGKAKKQDHYMKLLRTCNGTWEDKTISVWEKGMSIYPSDQANFPYGVGICALHRGKVGLYMDKIHTKNDTVLDERNVNFISDTLIQMLDKSKEDNKNETV